MGEIEIRGIVESYYEEWLMLFDLCMQFYSTGLPKKVKRATFTKALDPAINMWSSLAFHPETKTHIGFVNYLGHLSTWSTTDKLYINDLCVEEGIRLKSVGGSLIEYVYLRGD